MFGNISIKYYFLNITTINWHRKKSAFHIVNKVVAKTSRLTARKISLCKQNEVRNIESEIYKSNAKQSLNVYKSQWLNEIIKHKNKKKTYYKLLTSGVCGRKQHHAVNHAKRNTMQNWEKGFIMKTFYQSKAFLVTLFPKIEDKNSKKLGSLHRI